MIQVPNHTQVPNVFMDVHMKNLSGSQIKILLAITRKTIGWHKQTSEAIAYSQMKDLTGLENSAISTAIGELEKMGLVVTSRKKGCTTRYELNFSTSPESREDLSENQRGTSPESRETKQTPKETTERKCVSYSPRFEEIWEIYPRKINKAGAWKAYRARTREGVREDLLAACVAEYAKQVKGKEETFILHGATFFGPNHRYDDYRPKPKLERGRMDKEAKRSAPKPSLASLKVSEVFTPQEIAANKKALDKLMRDVTRRKKVKA